MPEPGTHQYDVQKQRLRRELEDQGVDDEAAERYASEEMHGRSGAGDSTVRPRLPPKASPAANPPGDKRHKPAEPAAPDPEEELDEMTSITVTAAGPDRFGVEVEEGRMRTTHLVSISDAVVDQVGLDDVDREQLVRESIAFLLDRQPATTFGEQLSLDELSDRHPEYIDEVRARLGNA